MRRFAAWIAGRSARARNGIALLSGLASALGFVPFSLWPLTLAGVAMLLVLTGQARTMRQVLATGWWWGTGHFLASLYWIAHAFLFQANMPPALGWVAVVLLSMLMAIYPAAAAGLGWRLGRRGLAQRTLALAAGWMLCEWLRGYVFGGFPWNPLGIVLLPLPGLPHAAAAIGGLGLSGLTVALAGGLLLAFGTGAARRTATGIGLLAVVAAVGGLIWSWQAPPAAPPAALYIVQANVSQSEKWDPAVEEMNLRRHIRLSPGPSTPGPPRLVIWPEAAVVGLLDEDPLLQLRLGALLRPGDLLLTGGDKALRGPDGYAYAARNSLFVVGPGGDLRDRYDKAVLVPFGEYLPLRAWLTPLGIARLVPGDMDFWPGPGPRTLRLPGFPSVSPQICYEIVVSGHVADRRDRPAWILNASNDAWFSDGGAWMHLAQARLRAIEEGLPVVRATPTGVSAIIDGHGRVQASLGRGVADVLRGTLPGALPPTLFARTGPAGPVGLALILLLLAVLLNRR